MWAIFGNGTPLNDNYSNKNMRQTWKNINRQLGKIKISSYASLSINNITIDDPKQITNHFNNYFVNIASKLVSNLPQLPHNF